ncbi:MAG: 3-hydroxyacyl-ACP dehydratase FabZ [Candidatus Caenarcaniphilales bacterium]|nr:3-hydroxyacyl-ACP dehydratase FabZ [Candidatus Caenarcaniphilales bacterium]
MDFSSIPLPIKTEEIKGLIPHRYPFLLVDRVTEISEAHIKGYKNVSVNEQFFQGHFPDIAVMPGVLIIEALAQISCIHEMSIIQDSNKIGMFAGIDKARFKAPVLPGDQLILESKVIWSKRGVGKCSAEAKVDETLVCSCELAFALVDKDKLK